MKGLVLEGGGARGSYHIGAYKAILEEGIEIQGIAGTSIGALNGAMIVQGDFELCYKLWEEISYSMIVNEKDEEIQKILNMSFKRDNLLVVMEKVKELIKGRGFDITPFKELLNTYIDEGKIRESDMDFGIVTINLSDLKSEQLFIEDIPKGKLKDYLLASAYLPIFKMERLEGKFYLDGGFYNNLPFNLLYDKGYQDLILIRTHAPGLTRKIDTDHLNATIISPSEDIGRTYNYDAENAKKNIRLGYYDALKVLRGLAGKIYYIEKREEDYFLEFLLSVRKDKVRRIGKLLNLPLVTENRLLFEYIIPKLASMMDLDSEYTYGDVLINLLERKAVTCKIPKFKIYTFEELLNLVRSKATVKVARNKEGPLERIIDKIDLPSIFNKEDIVLEIGNIIFCQ